MKTMKLILLAIMLSMLGALPAQAVHPADWAYHNGNYAYSPDAPGWFYFNALDTQWVVDINDGVWGTIDDLTGWVYNNWPYAYSRDTASWHWFNTPAIKPAASRITAPSQIWRAG